MSRAAFAAAGRWKCRVYVFEGSSIVTRAFPPCPCRGTGLVPRQVEVRGKARYTFDVCKNANCVSRDRFKQNRGVKP